MNAEAIRKRSIFKLEALPPDLRDLPRSCHPMGASQSQNQNRRTVATARHGLAPESALRLHPCRALSSAPVSNSVEQKGVKYKMVVVVDREK